MPTQQEVDMWRREAERLRAALKKIADSGTFYGSTCREMARDALEQKVNREG